MFRQLLVATLGLMLPAMLPAAPQIQRSARGMMNFPRIERVNPYMSLAAEAKRRQAPPAAAESESKVVMQLHPTEEEFDELKIVDANNDGVKISYYYAVSGFDGTVFDWPIFYEGNRKNQADDWVFTTAVTLDDASTLYEVAIDARVGATNVAESFEIYLGKGRDVESMTILALDQPSFTDLEFTKFSGRFAITEAGEYYIGIHVKSPASGWRVMLRDLSLSKCSEGVIVPAAPTDGVAFTRPADGGGYEAKVSFLFPTLDLQGKALDASRDVKVAVSSDIDEVKLAGRPGEEGTATIKCPAGTSTITLVASSDDGVGGSLRLLARPEFDVPSDPVVTTKISDNNMGLTLTWDPVTTGANGGSLNHSELTYNVYQYIEADGEDNYYAGWAPVATKLTATEYNFSTTEPTQQLYQFIVTARTSAGESEGNRESAGLAVLGQLYEMPFVENYSNGNVNYSGYIIDTPDENYEAIWGFSDVYSMVNEAGHVGAFCGISNASTPTKGRVMLPKFNLKGSHDMELTLNVFLDEYTAKMGIYLYGSNGMAEKIGEITPAAASQWREFSFAIPAGYDNLPWAYVMFDGSFATALNHFFVSSISMRTLESRDLAVTELSMPSVALGEPFELKATLRNAGYETMNAPTLKAAVMCGNHTMAKFDMAPSATSLGKGETAPYAATIKLNKADFLGKQLKMLVYLEEADDQTANNYKSTLFKVNSVKHPVVSDLRGDHNGTQTGISLSWSNPIGEAWVESFENMTHGDYSSKLGDWQNIDYDRQYVWAVEDVNFPYDVEAKAFQVIDASQLNNSNYGANTGTNFLVAFCPQDETVAADDWLISPEIDADGGLSFYMGIISTPFEEVIEVLCSSTDRELDSFKAVRTVKKNTWGWEKVTVDIPSDAKYFALHYKSRDQFGVLIDDIAFTPAGNDYDLVGYNVYRNDQKLTASPIIESNYEDIHGEYAKNSYNVSVVARHKGVETEFPLSNTVNLTTGAVASPVADKAAVWVDGGAIFVKGVAEGTTVNVYAVDGTLVASAVASDGTCRVAVQNGIYLVSTSAGTAKIAVR